MSLSPWALFMIATRIWPSSSSFETLQQGSHFRQFSLHAQRPHPTEPQKDTCRKGGESSGGFCSSRRCIPPLTTTGLTPGPASLRVPTSSIMRREHGLAPTGLDSHPALRAGCSLSSKDTAPALGAGGWGGGRGRGWGPSPVRVCQIISVFEFLVSMT